MENGARKVSQEEKKDKFIINCCYVFPRIKLHFHSQLSIYLALVWFTISQIVEEEKVHLRRYYMHACMQSSGISLLILLL